MFAELTGGDAHTTKQSHNHTHNTHTKCSHTCTQAHVCRVHWRWCSHNKTITQPHTHTQHAYKCSHTCTQAHICGVHWRWCSHTHTHTHTHTYTHTHTHTHSGACSRSSLAVMLSSLGASYWKSASLRMERCRSVRRERCSSLRREWCRSVRRERCKSVRRERCKSLRRKRYRSEREWCRKSCAEHARVKAECDPCAVIACVCVCTSVWACLCWMAGDSGRMSVWVWGCVQCTSHVGLQLCRSVVYGFFLCVWEKR